MMVHQYIDIPHCPDQNPMPKVQTVWVLFVILVTFFHFLYIPPSYPLSSLPEPSPFPSTLFLIHFSSISEGWGWGDRGMETREWGLVGLGAEGVGSNMEGGVPKVTSWCAGILELGRSLVPEKPPVFHQDDPNQGSLEGSWTGGLL